MSHSNPKTVLQEICQRRSTPIPRYESKQFPNKTWTSRCTVLDASAMSYSVFHTKKAAEQSAALRFLDENCTDEENTITNRDFYMHEHNDAHVQSTNIPSGVEPRQPPRSHQPLSQPRLGSNHIQPRLGSNHIQPQMRPMTMDDVQQTAALGNNPVYGCSSLLDSNLNSCIDNIGHQKPKTWQKVIGMESSVSQTESSVVVCIYNASEDSQAHYCFGDTEETVFILNMVPPSKQNLSIKLLETFFTEKGWNEV